MNTLATDAATLRLPRLGFLGVGWIGLSRMKSLAESGAAHIAAIADSSTDRVYAARMLAPAAAAAASLDELLEQDIDAVVIATPSALHAEQAVRAFEAGRAVFCQKPLAPTAAGTRRVIDAARAADLLLGVDLSYRHTAALRAVRAVVRGGVIGPVHAVDLVFHNAYGPDRGWARDPQLAGGGCVIDLGIHLVDAALWVLDFPGVAQVSSQLYAHGRRLPAAPAVCEDHAVATIELDNGATIRMTCSWESHTGADAVIEAAFYGSGGGAILRNVNGSFLDFAAYRATGAAAEPLAVPPDAWGGRALVEWSERLARGARYDADVESIVDVAATLDRILGR